MHVEASAQFPGCRARVFALYTDRGIISAAAAPKHSGKCILFSGNSALQSIYFPATVGSGLADLSSSRYREFLADFVTLT